MTKLIKRNKETGSLEEYDSLEGIPFTGEFYHIITRKDNEDNVITLHELKRPKPNRPHGLKPLSSEEQARRSPLPPWVLMNALNDPVHSDPPKSADSVRSE